MKKSNENINLPFKAGNGWSLYTYDYMTQDGLFCGYFYALDMGHAVQLLEEMKSTAVLSGEMVATIPNDDGFCDVNCSWTSHHPDCVYYEKG